jgi:hypothetical protein
LSSTRGQEPRHGAIIVFVVEVPKRFFKDVFQRDDANRCTLSINDDSHVTSSRLPALKAMQATTTSTAAISRRP